MQWEDAVCMYSKYNSHANSSKIVLMGIISNVYVFAESPKFTKFALDFS